ncbi:hypothetical protein F8154_14460 [Alkaliphilus pronyensis]|uniref:Uncharacterized protein n=1 Tax=Alkaliphilus pronyensis TaxID=1482732 RepID=A0A6I0FBM7_9FIRM|nr:hypothetical protein [Alkaliphilus pronyensis]KAB3529789.1 hypothetical protein F8154_14460 [Alkaliphilus pronyensis]
MDDKIFNLLEKMYYEMHGMKDELRDDMLGMKDELRAEMRHGFVRLENKMDENHRALFDGYRQSIEAINETREKLEKLTDK